MPADVTPSTPDRDDEFDDFVDGDGPVTICGKEFVRSEILASDMESYREALAEWREQQRADLLDTATDRFPHPIAHCVYRFINSARTENERLQFLKDTWEAVIALTFALTTAEIRECGKQIEVKTEKARDFKRHLDSQNIRDRLEVIRVAYDSPVDLPLLRSIVSHKTIQQMIELNTRRNEDFAHLGTLSERRSAELVTELEPEVVSLLRALQPLQAIELVRFEGPGKRGEGRFETFMGHASTRTITARPLSSRAGAAVVGRSREEVLVIHGDHVIALSPMIVMRDGRGHRSELAFMKKRRVENGRSVLTFESFGVAEEFELDTPELAGDLDALKALFKQGEDATS
jgi:hypothetical protein